MKTYTSIYSQLFFKNVTLANSFLHCSFHPVLIKNRSCFFFLCPLWQDQTPGSCMFLLHLSYLKSWIAGGQSFQSDPPSSPPLKGPFLSPQKSTSSLVMRLSTTSLWYRMSFSAVMASRSGALISVGPNTIPRFSLDIRFSFSFWVTLWHGGG